MTAPEEGEIRTSLDPQPPDGSQVRDALGQVWQLDGDDYRSWWNTTIEGDVESWVKIAGNYGPVTILRWGYGEGS